MHCACSCKRLRNYCPNLLRLGPLAWPAHKLNLTPVGHHFEERSVLGSRDRIDLEMNRRRRMMRDLRSSFQRFEPIVGKLRDRFVRLEYWVPVTEEDLGSDSVDAAAKTEVEIQDRHLGVPGILKADSRWRATKRMSNTLELDGRT